MSAKTTNSTASPRPGVLPEISAAQAATLDERGIPKHLGRLQRAVTLEGYDKASRTVTLAVSSETPVERYYGSEILSHDKGAIDLSRINQGVTPLLFNHNYDAHLGRVASAKIQDGVLRVTASFAGNPLAREKEGDVETGDLVAVSIGYIVDEWDVVEKKDMPPVFTAVRWQLLEVSLVTVPADPTVGVGRASDPAPHIRSFVTVAAGARKADPDDDETDPEDKGEEDDETTDEADRAAAAETAQRSVEAAPPSSDPNPNPAPPVRTTMEEVKDTAAENQLRVTGLTALRTSYPNEFSERKLKAAIDLGSQVDDVKRAIADAIIAGAERNEVPTIADELFGDMSERELSQYSLRDAYARAVNIAKPGTLPSAERGFVDEVSETLKKSADKRGLTGIGSGLMIPSATSRAMAMVTASQRNLAAGGNAGTYTNFTTVEAEVIELLRSRTAVLALGARMMTGLQGTLQMPRQTGAATSSWVPETSAVTSSDPTLDAITMAPHPLMIASAYYRNLLAQSRLAVDSFLAYDRMRVLALSLDTAAIAGAGSGGVPLGLLNQSGLPAILAGTTRASSGTVTAGAGGVPLTYVDFNNMDAAIDTANADIGTKRWLTTPKVRAAARSTPQIPGTASLFVWPDSKVDAASGLQAGPLGYDALCTTSSVLTGFTANSIAGLHAAILGVWDQMIIGDWGLSEIIVDPYTGAASNLIKITENAFYDTNVRHIPAFVACTSALPS